MGSPEDGGGEAPPRGQQAQGGPGAGTPSSRPTRCAVHGLAYDGAIYTGCVLCRREQGEVIQEPVADDEGLSKPLQYGLLAAVGLTFALQLLVIYAPPLNPIFNTVPLSAADLAICIAVSGIVAALVEVEKWYRRSRFARAVVR